MNSNVGSTTVMVESNYAVTCLSGALEIGGHTKMRLEISFKTFQDINSEMEMYA